MQTHTVQRNTKQKRHVQVGRGGRHGKTSGRGGKGQTARAGHKRRPQLRDAIKKIPKLRGYRFASIETPEVPVNLAMLQSAYSAGERVTPATLIEKMVITTKNGKVPSVKILARGEVSKKLVVAECKISAAARTAIESAGGSVEAY